jgi:DNA replicative helicase MCM subunit Mcm2 (Cdc46/Mcm family)
VYIEGTIKSKSKVLPLIVSARFECPGCGNVLPVLQRDNKFREPSACPCGRRARFRMLSRELVNAQSITIEEDISKIGEDTVPQRIKVMIRDDVV